MSITPWEKLQEKVRGKKVVVYGLGLQGGGLGVANTLARAGAQVHVMDKKSAQELASSLELLEPGTTFDVGSESEIPQDTALVIKNPAVPFTHPIILQAEKQGIYVTTEAALALECVRDQAIGITGTRGKTTTTTLTHAILLNAGLSAVLCGNIPDKPLVAALEEGGAETLFVIELSSFQIEGCMRAKISPHIAAVTNVYPDHLNRYADTEEYAQTKAALFSWQKLGDHAFFADWHDWTQTLRSEIQPGVEAHLLSTPEREAADHLSSSLPGEHNRENIAFAVAIAQTLGVTAESISQTVSQFRGVAFRLEVVAETPDRTYINDTTSTTPIALQRALEAQKEPFVLIFGGTTKHLPIEPKLLRLLQTQPKAVVALEGSGTEELMHLLGEVPPNWSTAPSLAQAVKQADQAAEAASVRNILFSPGFSSFELFDNEFDRGRQFNELVQEP